MSYYVYMLKEKSSNTTYVGYTKNLEERVKLHNFGKGAKFTRGRKWKLIYSEAVGNKGKAISRENYIKKIENSEILLKITTDENFNTFTI